MWLTLFEGWMVKGWQENRKEMFLFFNTVHLCRQSFLEYGIWNKRSSTLPFYTMGCIQPASPRWLLFPTFLINFLFFPISLFPHLFSFFFYFLFIVVFSLYLSLSLSAPFLSLSSFLFNVWMTSGTLGCCYYAWCTKLSTTHLCCWLLAWENCSNSISWQYHMEYSV